MQILKLHSIQRHHTRGDSSDVHISGLFLQVIVNNLKPQSASQQPLQMCVKEQHNNLIGSIGYLCSVICDRPTDEVSRRVFFPLEGTFTIRNLKETQEQECCKAITNCLHLTANTRASSPTRLRCRWVCVLHAYVLIVVTQTSCEP